MMQNITVFILFFIINTIKFARQTGEKFSIPGILAIPTGDLAIK